MNSTLTTTVCAVSLFTVFNLSLSAQVVVSGVKNAGETMLQRSVEGVTKTVPFSAGKVVKAGASQYGWSAQKQNILNNLNRNAVLQFELLYPAKPNIIPADLSKLQNLQIAASDAQQILSTPPADFYALFTAIANRHYKDPAFYNTITQEYYYQTADLINHLNAVKTAKGYDALKMYLSANSGRIPALTVKTQPFINTRELSFYAREELAAIFARLSKSNKHFVTIQKNDWALINIYSLFLRKEMRQYVFQALMDDNYAAAAYLLQNNKFNTPLAKEYIKHLNTGSAAPKGPFTLSDTAERITKRQSQLKNAQAVQGLVEQNIETLKSQINATNVKISQLQSTVPSNIKNIRAYTAQQTRLVEKLHKAYKALENIKLEQVDLAEQIKILAKKKPTENNLFSPKKNSFFPWW